MTDRDARFEDGGERPLYLKARDADDLAVISALVQDSVLPVPEMRYDRAQRRFGMLVNRFRWEDVDSALARKRPVERVQAVLVIDDVQGVASQGFERGDPDLILSVLTLGFEPGEDGAGRLIITLAGDGAIALEVEALEVSLKDVTRPYVAPSRKMPQHRD
ncbi:MAG: DUF2948 family protein [Paracoccaceae bacterium]